MAAFGVCVRASTLRSAAQGAVTASARQQTVVAPRAAAAARGLRLAAAAPLRLRPARKSVVVMAGKEVHLAAEGVRPFNGPVSAAERDSTAFGSERPGMLTEWDAPGAIPNEAVDEWVAHMKGAGITQAMSLLNPEELTYYATPLAEQYGKAFTAYEIVDMKAKGAHEKAMAFLSAADASGDKVVLHCSGGQGRTGLILASWLVQKYGLSVEEAVKEMLEHATANNASRSDVTGKLPGFIEKGSA